MKAIDLHIEGMTCAACSGRIEKVLTNIPGVQAHVSLLEHRARVSGISIDDAIAAIRRAGYDAWPAQAAAAARLATDTPVQTGPQTQQFRLWISLAAMVPMAIEMAGMAWQKHGLIPIAVQWILATIMQAFVAWPFYRSAWRAVASGSANMETLIVIGTMAAYAWSVAIMLGAGMNASGHTPAVYFEISIVVIGMVTIGRYIEGRARKRALDALSKLTQIDRKPVETWDAIQQAWVMSDPAEIATASRIRLYPRQAISMDAMIEEGQTEVDESSMTGESMPISKGPGAMLYAGCSNLSDTVIATVTAPFDGSRRALMGERIMAALSSRAPIAALADRIAAVFVPVVLLIALATFAVHLALGTDLSFAMANAVAVLVVACPCALGLATPAAIAAGLARSAQFGWLFQSADAMERAASTDHVVFDKTGTLTSGRPKLIAMADTSGELFDADRDGQHDALRGPWPFWLAAATSIERGVEHPLAGALLSYAAGRPMPATSDLQHAAGKGVSGICAATHTDGHDGGAEKTGPQRVVVGSPDWVGGAPEHIRQMHPNASAVDVAIDGQWQGRLWIADSLRPDAASAMAELQRDGLRVSILSGDRHTAVARIAHLLGDVEWLAAQSPEAKAAQLDQWRSQGRHPAMAGDGINDASAMAHAHLGIAMASGASLALQTADLTVSSSSPLLAAARSLRLARAVMRRVKENLFFAFAFNILAIPLAAIGMLSPVIAGSAMAMSSALVMLNASRLLNWKPR
jgi:Cu+-exporting ATPase